jgi:hypothetical protein
MFIIRKITMYLLVLALLFPAAQAQTGLEKTTVTYKKVDGHEILADVR